MLFIIQQPTNSNITPTLLTIAKLQTNPIQLLYILILCSTNLSKFIINIVYACKLFELTKLSNLSKLEARIAVLFCIIQTRQISSNEILIEIISVQLQISALKFDLVQFILNSLILLKNDTVRFVVQLLLLSSDTQLYGVILYDVVYSKGYFRVGKTLTNLALVQNGVEVSLNVQVQAVQVVLHLFKQIRSGDFHQSKRNSFIRVALVSIVLYCAEQCLWW